jgi:hypothetical protein
MTTHSENLVSLEELRSVLNRYAGPDEPRHRPARHGLRRLRPVLVVALAVVALAGTGAAIADGFGAFDGIGAANHPQTGADVIDPATAAFLEGKNCSGSYNPKTGALPNHKVCSGIPIGLQLDSARHLGQLPDGQNVYVITRKGANDNLCTVVGPPHPEIECNSTLSRSHPTTIFVYAANQPAASPLTFGVALDGVTSVSLQAGDYPNGQEVTVPVNGNLWIYPEVVNLLQPVTANFTDGTTVVEPGQGAGCAAC